jgi:cysteine desulfurase
MRIYLDHNSTAPLRNEAKQAMVEAMSVVGNPSSVHLEGRAAKALIENARMKIAAAIGAVGADIIFTSGATESAALALVGRDIACSKIEHEAVTSWCDVKLPVDRHGLVNIEEPSQSTLQFANSETGIIQKSVAGLWLSDMTQAFGKVPLAFNWLGCNCAMISAHKIGGPKGVGALIVKRGTDLAAQIKGGGQEMGRRSGTENVIGIVGFGAAAEVAEKDLRSGKWEKISQFRMILENMIEEFSDVPILIGKDSYRLPNTTCLVTPGWKGVTQVMQMDLEGIAVSAGSACSSGKVKSSDVLKAIGLEESDASCALRISLGLNTTEEDVVRFAEIWTKKFENNLKRKNRN